MVVVPNRRSLRHYRDNRVERQILVQSEPLRKHAVPYAVSLSRGLRGIPAGIVVTTSMLTSRAKQSFYDHHGTDIPYRGQLYHLGKNHDAAGSAILSPESKVL
jgi:hypothetical protein